LPEKSKRTKVTLAVYGKRGASGKVAVFGLVKRSEKVFAKVIENAKTDTLMPMIREKIVPDSVVYTDCFKSYNILDISEFHHYRINHSKVFADKKNHINSIENFGNQAKRHLRRFNGIKKGNFLCFLKKCEWRFNNPNHKDQFNLLYQMVKLNMLLEQVVKELYLRA
jgi:transposase